MSMNYVFLMGRLAEEPNLKVAQSRVSYVTFHLMVEREYSAANSEGKRGYFKKKKDVFTCCAWGKQAEAIKRYCSKGNMLLVIGKLESWTKQNKRTKEFQKFLTVKVIQTQIFDWRRNAPPVNTAPVRRDKFDDLFEGLEDVYEKEESYRNRSLPDLNIDSEKFAGARNDPYMPTEEEIFSDEFGEDYELVSDFEDEESEE